MSRRDSKETNRPGQATDSCRCGRLDCCAASLANTPVNRQQIVQLECALMELFVRTLRRGFSGGGTLKFVVHDGTIVHSSHGVEQIEE